MEIMKSRKELVDPNTLVDSFNIDDKTACT